jgi:hypothetical protein
LAERAPNDPRRQSTINALRLTFTLLGLVALIFGYIGFSEFAKNNSYQPTAWDLLYYDLQLFVLGADPLQNPGPYPFALQIARFAAATVTIYALVETGRLIFATEVRRLRVRWVRGHVIVCGATPMADALSRQLRSAGRRVVEVRPAFDPLAVVQRGPLRVNGDARDPEVLRAAGVARATALYACTSDSATNTATALAAGPVRPASGSALAVYAQVHDPELCLALQARYLGLPHPPGLRLDFFNAEDLAARKLVAGAPLAAVDGRPPKVLVVSASAFGRAVMVELARLWRIAGPGVREPLPVTLVDPAADAVVDDLGRRYPFLRRVCRFSTYRHDLLDLLAQGELREPPDRAYICDDDEQRALKTAITADRFWCGAPNSVVVRLDQLAALHDRLRFGGSLRVYGGVQAASDPQLIGEDLVERLARVIHDQYRLSRLADGVDTRAYPFMVSWEELPHRIRLTNRAQAEDVGRKLQAIGCVLVPRGGHDEIALLDAEIDTLAIMEHERWRAERAADGWRYAAERDDDGKLHPAIADWYELPEQIRKENYDEVRELPMILSDAGFQIVRG